MNAHAWTLRIRSLHYGDALTIGDYHVYHYMTRDWMHVYMVRRNGVTLLKCFVRGKLTQRMAWEQVAVFMANEKLNAVDAVWVVADPVAMMLSGYPPEQAALGFDVLEVVKASKPKASKRPAAGGLAFVQMRLIA